MKTLILASSSPRRKALLKQLGLGYIVIPSLLEEKFNPRLKPRGQAEALALQKAKNVWQRFLEDRTRKAAVIVAADTIVVINDEVLGKPKDKREAKKMLNKLSGKCHRVITGFSIIDTDSGKITTKSVVTLVYFKKLSKSEISLYVEKEKIMDKAGAYAAQGIGATFIERIEGDYSSIIGLPLYPLSMELKKHGIRIL